jgi:serine/threonine-protein kinase
MTDFREQLQSSLGNAYTIERELGGGGMSRVFVATETALGRRVVVKVVSLEVAAGVSMTRFAREIRLAASLQQANIVPLLSAGESAGLPYYTMPFVDGSSLRERLSTAGALSITEVVSVLRDVARALAYAHDRGIVHRDIKPDNVLLSGDAAVVTDFGIAKAIIQARTYDSGPDVPGVVGSSTVTQIGTAIGTPAYMPPEQAAGDPETDHRADIYSFGCLAYELLSGETPFHGRPVHQLFTAHVRESPVPIATRRADCPPALARIVMHSLEKDPMHRPQSAREILQALDAATTPSSFPAPVHRVTRRQVITTIVGAAAILALGGAAARMLGRSPDTGTAKALAVLPFANVGGDSAQEYLADGMTDELATALGKMPGVQVAARTMAYRYKGKRDIDARDVGRNLGVGLVLQGTVRRAGTQLRVSAQLTNADDGKELWSDTFGSGTQDVFALQDELTRAITAALATRLSGRPAPRVAAKVAEGTSDAEAYDLYLRGRFLLLQRRRLPQAVEIFQSAIQKDSSFARAYAGLGETLQYLPYFASTPAVDVRERTMRAARRALALDSTLSEAHVALGLAHMHAWEWSAAEDEFRRAIAADSTDASAYTQYARFLLYTARPREALIALNRAQKLEPYSAVISGWIVASLSMLGRNDEALAESRRALEMDSTTAPVIHISILAYVAAGRNADAKRLAERSPLKMPPFILQLAYADGMSGDRDGALKIAHEFEVQRPRPWFSETVIAFARLAVGDTARALDAFERSTDAREIWPTFTPICDRAFDPIRGTPRFAALVRRVGLDEHVLTSATACLGR